MRCEMSLVGWEDTCTNTIPFICRFEMFPRRIFSLAIYLIEKIHTFNVRVAFLFANLCEFQNSHSADSRLNQSSQYKRNYLHVTDMCLFLIKKIDK